MLPTTIELHIESLVLYGFPPGDAFRIGNALEKALERVFLERGLPKGFSGALEISELDLGTLVLPANPAPHAIGSGISKALHRVFAQPLPSGPSSTLQTPDFNG